MMRSVQERRGRGFTLIEVIIVIAIIGILAAIAVPLFMQHRAQSMFATMISDAKNAHIAVVVWQTTNHTDPFPPETIGPLGVGSNYLSAKASAGNTITIAGGLAAAGGGVVTVANNHRIPAALVTISLSGEITGTNHLGNAYP